MVAHLPLQQQDDRFAGTTADGAEVRLHSIPRALDAAENIAF
jgi:hypothetical protein